MVVNFKSWCKMNKFFFGSLFFSKAFLFWRFFRGYIFLGFSGDFLYYSCQFLSLREIDKTMFFQSFSVAFFKKIFELFWKFFGAYLSCIFVVGNFSFYLTPFPSLRKNYFFSGAFSWRFLNQKTEEFLFLWR